MKTNFYGPILVILVGLFTLSVGLNVIFYNRIIDRDKTITNTTSPVKEKELEQIKKEIDRLSNIQYNIKTKQPIENQFIQ